MLELLLGLLIVAVMLSFPAGRWILGTVFVAAVFVAFFVARST